MAKKDNGASSDDTQRSRLTETSAAKIGEKRLISGFIRYYRPHRVMLTFDMLASIMISVIGMVYPVITNIMLKDLIPNRKFRMVIIAGLSVLALYVMRLFLRYFVQ